MNLGELNDRLFELREKKDKLRSELSEVQAEIDKVEYQLIEKMEETGLDKISTDRGTASMKIEIYPSVADLNALVNWAYENNKPEIVQKRVSKKVFEEWFEQTGEFPEGIKTYERKKLNVRRK